MTARSCCTSSTSGDLCRPRRQECADCRERGRRRAAPAVDAATPAADGQRHGRATWREQRRSAKGSQLNLLGRLRPHRRRLQAAPPAGRGVEPPAERDAVTFAGPYKKLKEDVNVKSLAQPGAHDALVEQLYDMAAAISYEGRLMRLAEKLSRKQCGLPQDLPGARNSIEVDCACVEARLEGLARIRGTRARRSNHARDIHNLTRESPRSSARSCIWCRRASEARQEKKEMVRPICA